MSKMLALWFASAAFAFEPASVCVAPVPEKADRFSAPGFFCDPKSLTLRIDKQEPMPWPIKGSLKIDAVDASASHRVVVYCGGKPQQSFRFRFSEFKTKDLCLFLNDLYKTVQLAEAEQCPWCKCK
jgi:hypothetical protein